MIQSSRGYTVDCVHLIHGSHWHCVIQVRRQARSRDDRENPRRSYITILSLLPIQRFKFWRQLSASWVCCMFSFTSPEPDVPVYYPPQIQSPLPIRSSRFIQQMENWAMAGSVRRRMECGIQLSCMQTVSDWEENMAEFPVSIQWSQVHGGRKECCMLQVCQGATSCSTSGTGSRHHVTMPISQQCGHCWHGDHHVNYVLGT